MLVNYNMLDFEKAKKNIEAKKKMPGYVAYDDTEEDEFGVVSSTFSFTFFFVSAGIVCGWFIVQFK